ncbi:glycoside hydrolase family 1 protein [Candidatus Jorgensenbacteria bacterium]|nr:glycoside hydrolase family 1 protein [Candidatus Jorgensenbacteria bacterium]
MKRIIVIRLLIILAVAITASLLILEHHLTRQPERHIEKPQLSNDSAKTLPPPKKPSSLPKVEITDYPFPKGFMWGVAISAFQNEGGNGKTDWDEWPEYKASTPRHPGFDENDITLTDTLGIKYIRFSIEWARIEPEENVWDEQELKRYVGLARVMQKKNIQPFVNLYHFSLPAWVAHKGGWANDSISYWFNRYTAKVAKAFRPLKIKWWMTMNEPTVVIMQGYFNGTWPPEKERATGLLRPVQRNLMRAHRLTYHTLHSILDRKKSKISVGVAYLDQSSMPKNPEDILDRETADAYDLVMNTFIDGTEDEMDYVGLNYYNIEVTSVNRFKLISPLFFGLPVEFSERTKPYPRGIYERIRKLRAHRKPIIVTENGIDDGTDSKRPSFIVRHLYWVHRATLDPENTIVPVIGYFHWTLVDNAEWGRHEPSHFGLVDVNSETKERTPRPSALLYREIIRSNSLTEAMVEQYINKDKSRE